MKKWIPCLVVALIFSGTSVFAGSLDLLVGYVYPKGNSDVYEQNEAETTFKVSDLNDFGGTVRYSHFLGDYVNLGAGFSYYQSDTTVEDLDFEFQNGQPILRNIALEIVPLEVHLHILPAGRDQAVIPYFGGGIGVYFWQYEELGDFVINRFSPDPEIITGSAFSDGTDPGFHVEGGVMIPVTRSMTITAEAKYWKAEGDLDVRGFDPSFEPLDLSGTMFSGGVSFWF